MYVPYNNNKLYSRPASGVMDNARQSDDLHMSSPCGVEGTLAPANITAPKRRLYIDEDTWLAVYSDSWNEDGKRGKFGQATMYLCRVQPHLAASSSTPRSRECLRLRSRPLTNHRPHPPTMFSRMRLGTIHALSSFPS